MGEIDLSIGLLQKNKLEERQRGRATLAHLPDLFFTDWFLSSEAKEQVRKGATPPLLEWGALRLPPS